MRIAFRQKRNFINKELQARTARYTGGVWQEWPYTFYCLYNLKIYIIQENKLQQNKMALKVQLGLCFLMCKTLGLFFSKNTFLTIFIKSFSPFGFRNIFFPKMPANAYETLTTHPAY